MRDRELILRFLAFLFAGDIYKRPMAFFLTWFMGARKVLDEQTKRQTAQSFTSSMDLVFRSIGEQAFRPVRALNAAVLDAVMVGTARRLQRGPVTNEAQYREAYESLLSNQAFLDACGRGTASEERVRTRLKLANDAFAAVQ